MKEILYFLKSESIHSEKNPNLLKKLVVESRTKEAQKHGQKCATKGNRIIFPCKILLRLKGMFVAFAAFKCHLTRRKGVRFHEGWIWKGEGRYRWFHGKNWLWIGNSSARTRRTGKPIQTVSVPKRYWFHVKSFKGEKRKYFSYIKWEKQKFSWNQFTVWYETVAFTKIYLWFFNYNTISYFLKLILRMKKVNEKVL